MNLSLIFVVFAFVCAVVGTFAPQIGRVSMGNLALAFFFLSLIVLR